MLSGSGGVNVEVLRCGTWPSLESATGLCRMPRHSFLLAAVLWRLKSSPRHGMLPVEAEEKSCLLLQLCFDGFPLGEDDVLRPCTNTP